MPPARLGCIAGYSLPVKDEVIPPRVAECEAQAAGKGACSPCLQSTAWGRHGEQNVRSLLFRDHRRGIEQLRMQIGASLFAGFFLLDPDAVGVGISVMTDAGDLPGRFHRRQRGFATQAPAETEVVLIGPGRLPSTAQGEDRPFFDFQPLTSQRGCGSSAVA